MKKDAVLAKIKSEKVVALIRADNPDGLLDCAKALAAGGLTSIELTMTTPGAIRMLEKATAELPQFLFGLGTVLDAETARAETSSAERQVHGDPRPEAGRDHDLQALQHSDFLRRPHTD